MRFALWRSSWIASLRRDDRVPVMTGLKTRRSACRVSLAASSPSSGSRCSLPQVQRCSHLFANLLWLHLANNAPRCIASFPPVASRPAMNSTDPRALLLASLLLASGSFATAQSAPGHPSAPKPKAPSAGDPVTLSPFEVNTQKDSNVWRRLARRPWFSLSAGYFASSQFSDNYGLDPGSGNR